MYKIFEKLCKEHGVTPYRVCKETGLTTATISNWKAGRYIPKADKMQRIADYFNVSMEYLLTGENKLSHKTLNPTNELHENIKALRIENNISTKELAEVLHHPEKIYIDCENGKFKFTPDDVTRLSKYYNVDSDILYGITRQRKDYPKIEYIPYNLSPEIRQKLTVEQKNALLKREIEDSTKYFLRILRAMYGNIEYESCNSSNTPNRYILGENDTKFVLSENDISELYKSIRDILSIIIDKIKQSPEL